MTRLLDLVRHEARATHQMLPFDEWANYWDLFGGISQFWSQALNAKQEDIGSGFQGLVQGAYKRNGIVFAVETARLLHFTEARFQWQRTIGGRPGAFFGSDELSILEKPWPGATTGDLLGRMLLHADFAGTPS